MQRFQIFPRLSSDLYGFSSHISRNTLLEQISRLPHAPSVPFQTTPPTLQVPEEVST